MNKLALHHCEDIINFGEGNNERIDCDTFSYDTGNRTCSVRINNKCVHNKKGYFEDRRPGANCCPYIVTSSILDSIS